MVFKERLKKILKEKEITQYKLSKLSGIPQTTLSSIMNERSKSPSLDIVMQIAKTLGVTVSELIGEVEEEFTPELKELIKSARSLDKEEINAITGIAQTMKKLKKIK